MGKSSFFKDFKAFITKGNIIDMAVGVIIGGAFGKIVSSLVADIITPLISLALGKTDFTEIVWTLREATEDSEAIVMNGGTFIQTVIDSGLRGRGGGGFPTGLKWKFASGMEDCISY